MQRLMPFAATLLFAAEMVVLYFEPKYFLPALLVAFLSYADFLFLDLQES
jgi:hypothetical protein